MNCKNFLLWVYLLFCWLSPLIHKSFQIFLAMPVECRNSWVRDWTRATAVTQAAEWQRLILNPLHHKGTPVYFFNIYVPNLSNFSSAVCASDVIINKWLLNPISWSFSSVFSYKNFIILALIFFDPFWIYFCTWH